ncbi:MAG: enolase C-terminal domain-like protein [Terriglobia bacterium]
MASRVPPEDFDGYHRLCDSTSLRIAAGEQDVGRWTFRRLIWEASLDVLQPDISRVGGLTEAKRIAYMARAKRSSPPTRINRRSRVASLSSLELENKGLKVYHKPETWKEALGCLQ